MKQDLTTFFYFSDSCRSGFVLDGKNSGSSAEASCVYKPRQGFGARKQQ